MPPKEAKEGTKRVSCPKCLKTLSSKAKLYGHCLVKHQWSLRNEAPATDEEVSAYKEKQAKQAKQEQPP